MIDVNNRGERCFDIVVSKSIWFVVYIWWRLEFGRNFRIEFVVGKGCYII